MNSNLRIGIGTGILKRNRTHRSTETLPDEAPPYKKAREAGEFNHAPPEVSKDSSNPILMKRHTGDDNTSGSLQASSNDTSADLGQLSRQQIESLERLLPTRNKILRHSQSSDEVGLRNKGSLPDIRRTTRRNSMGGNSSSDPADLLPAQDKEFDTRGRGRAFDSTGIDLLPRLLPPVAQHLGKKSSTVGLITQYHAPGIDESPTLDAHVRFPKRIGASPSSSYPRSVISHISATVPYSEELSSSRVRRSVPKISKNRVPAVDASEADTPALDSHLSSMIKSNDSAEPSRDEETSHDDLPDDLQEEVDTALDAGKKEIAAVFAELGIPLSPNRIPKGGTGKYHTASTVTQDILKEHGSWEFNEKRHLQDPDGKRREKIDAVDVYVPIALGGDLVDLMDSPIIAISSDEQPDMDLHSNLESFLTGRKVHINNQKTKLYVAEDIAAEEVRNDRVAGALLIPKAYQDILDRYDRRMVPDADAGLYPDDEEASLPTSSPMKQPETHGGNNLRSEHHQGSKGKKKPSIAEQFVEQHKLGENEDDALRLREHISALEPEYNKRSNHQALCEKTGTAEERRQLEMNGSGDTMPLYTIEYAPRAFIEERDKNRRTGNAMMHENADDQNFGAVQRILRWVNHKAWKSTEGEEARPSEVDVETHVGALVKGLFWDHEQLKESANKSLHFVHYLQLFGTSPKADYAARLSGEAWKVWGLLLALCLLSGECKPAHQFNPHTLAQLAMNSVAGLIMIIIMHLSTRKSPSQKLLPWMFLYAFVYTEEGITIFAHYPKLVAEDGKPRWKFVSWRVSKAFEKVWTSTGTPELRIRGLAAVYLMRSHTEFVLEQLLAWSQALPESTKPLMETLITRAEEEMNVYQKVLRRLHTGVAKRIEA